MLTATDLFAGAGGSSEGLEQAGYDVRIAANHWPLAVHTHQANHPGTEHRVANLAEVDWRTFPTTDLLWASPSCVWHSRSGGRRKPPAEVELIGEDEGSVDRATAFAVIAAAEVHRYPTVLVENVPEFRDWTLYRWWKEGLHALGYYTQELVLDAADLGHAQRRKRLFMAATLDPVTITPSAPDRVPASVILDADPGKPVTRRLYVADQLDQITDDRRHLVTWRRNARPRPADEYPLATVTAGGNHHGVAQRIDGQMHVRMLNNRECARAQGFPDHYEFRGTQRDVKKQIGNAVPVGVARWLGVQAAGHDAEVAA